MGCYQPVQAYRSERGSIAFSWGGPYRYPVDLPCGKCTACLASKAREWALRCKLELPQHQRTVWTTLTYDETNVPRELRKADLSAFLKRLRERLRVKHAPPLRFFASGEYGEETQRPHYHAILFGTDDEREIEASWPHGHIRVDPISDAAINYVAGYTAKKLGWRNDYADEIDEETGEVTKEGRQAPFIHMSRRPGIGSAARQHWQSWRLTAIENGTPMPVPRYLHEAWRERATPEMLIKLRREKTEAILTRYERDTRTRAYKLEANEVLANQRHGEKSKRRRGT